MALLFSPDTLRNIFGASYNQISTLPITVTVKETHSFDQQITEKPVEDGAVIADNIILHPDQVTIQGIFADDQIADRVVDAITSLSLDSLTNFSTFEEKLQMLHEIRKQREPFDVVTSLATYKNMFFSGPIVIDRDASTATALFFNCTLKSIGIIQSRTTQVPAESTKDTKKMAPKKDKGKVSNIAGRTTANGSSKIPAATNQRSESWLSSITGLGI